MNDSHDIDMPYHPGCKHRYIEHLDHNALIKRLNEIADEIYRLTQLCVGLEEQLVNHDGSDDAHRSIRESITAVGTRISTIKVTIDDSIAALDDKVDANYSALNAADGQLVNRINSITDELEDIQNALDNISLNLGEGITSTVSGNTPIIASTSNSGNVTLAELPSTHGKFRYKVEDTRNALTYTTNSNNTGVPNYTTVLLDENGNAFFPKTVSATTFDGNATTATFATNAGKLNNSINITIKDASGENAGSTATTDLSSDVTLALPATLKGTDITGVASRASADATGANISDTYVHKTNVDETINGVKTFNDTIKSDTLVPKAHTGSTLGSSTIPYEYVYGTNINGVTATIPNITGSLTGNATTATKLSTARAINGTNFDGSTAITTNSWGTARNISIADASVTNTGTATSVNGSGNVTLKLPATIKAALTGNASTATKLNVTKKINNTAFDGSADITTVLWGTARNISIADASATNTGTATSVNGSGNVTLKLPATISATAFNGPASSAKKLNTAIRINGTPFDGSTDITTTVWGYARNFSITSSDGTGASGAVSVNGSSNVILKLPATIKANITGNIDTATKLKTARTINSTSFDGSANITTALWGTARNISIADASAAHTGSAVSVNGSSNVTLKLPATITATLVGNAAAATQFNSEQQIVLTGDVTGVASSKAGWAISTALSKSGVTAGSYGNSTNQTPAYGGTFNVPYITVDAKGRVTAIANKTVKIPASDNTDTTYSATSPITLTGNKFGLKGIHPNDYTTIKPIVSVTWSKSTKTLNLKCNAPVHDKYGRITGYEVIDKSVNLTGLAADTGSSITLDSTATTLYYTISGAGHPYSKGEWAPGSNLRTSQDGSTYKSGTYIATSGSTCVGNTSTSPTGSGTNITWYIYKQDFKKVTV